MYFKHKHDPDTDYVNIKEFNICDFCKQGRWEGGETKQSYSYIQNKSLGVNHAY